MNGILYYLPALHRDCAPDFLPEEVGFLAELLEGRAGSSGRMPVRPFPFSPAQGRALIREMLALGEAHGVGGGLLEKAVAAQREEEGRNFEAGEAADLAAFSEAGLAPGEQSRAVRPDAVLQALEAAQKVLLLAAAREERMREAGELEQAVLDAQRALAQSLGDGGAGSPDRASVEETQPVPWRPVLEAALAFLPEEAYFLTADPAMAEDLAALARDVPDNARPDLPAPVPELVPGLARGAGYVRAPGWLLAGRKGCPGEKPWLGREVEIIVCAPQQQRD